MFEYIYVIIIKIHMEAKCKLVICFNLKLILTSAAFFNNMLALNDGILKSHYKYFIVHLFTI